MADKVEKIEKVREEMEESCTLYSGADFESFQIHKIPIGIFSFDIATKGGIPEGRIIEFYGARSSSKSTSAYRAINGFRKVYPTQKALFVDFEQTYDPEWASHFIDDLDGVDVLTPDYGEEGVEALLKLAKYDEYKIIVIDSLAAMVPLGMLKPSVADDTMGHHPKLVNKLLRYIIPTMSMRKKNGNHLTLLILNHYTDRIGAFGAAAFVPVKPGGNMKEFMYTMNVRFKLRQVSKEASPVKWTYEFVIEKNKTRGGSRLSGEYTMYQQDHGTFKIGDIDEFEFIEKVAKKVGVLVRSGNKWNTFTEEFKNLDTFQEKLQSDKEFCRQVREATLSSWVGIEGGELDGKEKT